LASLLGILAKLVISLSMVYTLLAIQLGHGLLAWVKSWDQFVSLLDKGITNCFTLRQMFNAILYSLMILQPLQKFC